MLASPLSDLSRLAIHTQTNRPWSLRQCIDGYTAAGVRHVSVWRHALEPHGPAETGRMLRDAGLIVPALVRGGFFVAADPAARQKAIDDNHACIDEAAAIGADMIVMVVGAAPGVPLPEARNQVAQGLSEVLPHAAAANVKLAIEPLHPMYAADKSCVNRMAEARQLCEALNNPHLGIALDVYHTWWDPDLRDEIALAGRQNTLFAFHVCDWRADTRHLLTDRGLMGDGVIDIPTIRSWVEEAGFRGPIEVEVFSEEYWAMDQTDYVRKIGEAYLRYV